MKLKLIKADKQYQKQIIEMIDEWKQDIEVNHTNGSPSSIFKEDCHNFDHYITYLNSKEHPTITGHVPAVVYFAYDEDIQDFVGAIDCRLALNEGLLSTGGHIGDGIRPSKRRQGYATAMIGLALEKYKESGITKVLMCCSKENIGSAKSIINNGGILENEVDDDGDICQRYWISL